MLRPLKVVHDNKHAAHGAAAYAFNTWMRKYIILHDQNFCEQNKQQMGGKLKKYDCTKVIVECNGYLHFCLTSQISDKNYFHLWV